MKSALSSMPPMNSVARFLPDYNQPDPATPPFNRTMSYHDAAEGNCGIRNTDKIIRKDLGEPACLSDYLSMDDLYNGLAYRAIFEAANKARRGMRARISGKSTPPGRVSCGRCLTGICAPMAGYYSMTSACRPLHVHTAPTITRSSLSALCPRRVPT